MKKLRPKEPVWLLIDSLIDADEDPVPLSSERDADPVDEVVLRRPVATGVFWLSSDTSPSVSFADDEERLDRWDAAEDFGGESVEGGGFGEASCERDCKAAM